MNTLPTAHDEFTGFEVQLLSTEAISHYWPHLSEMLQRVPHTWQEYTLESLFEMTMGQRMQVWSIGTKTKVKMFVISQIAIYPAMRILQVIWGAGQGVLDDAEEVFDATIERFAQVQNCARIDVIGRRGWKKRAELRGFKETCVVLSRPVPPTWRH